MILTEIKRAIRKGKYNITNHADEEKEEDKLKLNKIFEATVSGKVIEDYPEDFPFPSCLIYGRTKKNKPIHAVWAFDKKDGIAILITVYRPSPKEWIDFEKRR